VGEGADSYFGRVLSLLTINLVPRKEETGCRGTCEVRLPCGEWKHMRPCLSFLLLTVIASGIPIRAAAQNKPRSGRCPVEVLPLRHGFDSAGYAGQILGVREEGEEC